MYPDQKVLKFFQFGEKLKKKSTKAPVSNENLRLRLLLNKILSEKYTFYQLVALGLKGLRVRKILVLLSVIQVLYLALYKNFSAFQFKKWKNDHFEV